VPVAKLRADLAYVVLVPLIVAAAAVLGYYTWETASRFEELGASSIAQATLLLVEEKVDRIEQQIISRDNAVFHLIDIADPEGLRSRWLPLAERVSPSVRAVLILTEELEVVDYVARAAPTEQRAFLRLFRRSIAPELMLAGLLPEQLRHLHVQLNGVSYLISYQTVRFDGQTFVLVAHHDTGYIVREEFPRLFANEEAGAYFNIVDEDGKRVLGDSLTQVADYLVGLRFPTTLYRWRLQVAPKDAPLLAQQARQREFNKAALVGLSVAVMLFGVAILLYATSKERRLNALKSEFIANVSHELKTPLSVIRMYAEMLATGRVASEQRRDKYLETICREAERLTGLIENVLDFAALERGKQRYARSEANLAEIVSRAVDTVKPRLGKTPLSVEVDPRLAPQLLDGSAVMLAVVNLLDNALKYGAGSPIALRVQQDTRSVKVSVRDHGPGIPSDDLRRVFERFYRVRSPGQTVRGSGIGLALVKHIAEAHGGRAWAENADGGGALVCFSLESPGRSHSTRLPTLTPGVSSGETDARGSAVEDHPARRG
jgi:two-component system, OmpR family, phosphate regulon sensor histidine kinase PhoR